MDFLIRIRFFSFLLISDYISYDIFSDYILYDRPHSKFWLFCLHKTLACCVIFKSFLMRSIMAKAGGDDDGRSIYQSTSFCVNCLQGRNHFCIIGWSSQTPTEWPPIMTPMWPKGPKPGKTRCDRDGIWSVTYSSYLDVILVICAVMKRRNYMLDEAGRIISSNNGETSPFLRRIRTW